MPFSDDIHNPACPLAVDFSPDRSSLLIACGGMAGMMGGIPPFEFFNITRDLPSNRIFLRDPHQLWYHKGLPGISHDIDSTVHHLRQFTNHPATRRTVVVGTSAGGYAALLLGHLLQAHIVHSFSPRTYLHPIRRFLHRDFLVWPRMLALLVSPRANRQYFDLKPLLATSPHAAHVHIHYADHHPHDKPHALRMASLPNLHLHPHPSAEHVMIRQLKNDGTLHQLLTSALTNPTTLPNRPGTHLPKTSPPNPPPPSCPRTKS